MHSCGTSCVCIIFGLYCIVVASLKGGSEKLNKGSEVIVLGSCFDPETNAPTDVEWPAKFVKFGKNRLFCLS